MAAVGASRCARQCLFISRQDLQCSLLGGRTLAHRSCVIDGIEADLLRPIADRGLQRSRTKYIPITES
jgi:hypothetical protein